MKMTNSEAYASLGILQKLKERGILGFAIAKNMRKLADELQEYDSKRNECIRKYGTQLEGDRYQFSTGAAEKYYAEMEPYDRIAFEFEPTTISEEVFCSGSLTSDQMYALMWMVEN